MIIETGQTPFVAVATAAPAGGYPKLSRDGAAFAACANAAVAMGEGYYGVRLTTQETAREGTLCVVFASGVGTIVQVRSLVAEVAREARVVTQNSQKALSIQVAESATKQQKALRDALNTYMSPFVQQLKPRHGDTGVK
jgi:hypothetical protein